MDFYFVCDNTVKNKRPRRQTRTVSKQPQYI